MAIYTAVIYAYLFPRNTEMSAEEKWLTIGVSAAVLGILWYLLRKREKLRREREEDIRNHKENSQK